MSGLSKHPDRNRDEPMSPASVTLTGDWVAGIYFAAEEHAALVATAERLARDYGAEVTKLRGFPEGSKEYWWLRLAREAPEGRDEATLLLMRKEGLGVSLAGGRRDNELVLRIADDWGAVPHEWRLHLWRAFHGDEREASTATARSARRSDRQRPEPEHHPCSGAASPPIIFRSLYPPV